LALAQGRPFLDPNFRALRGGSWLSNPHGLRVAYRYYELPGYRSYYVGFRPVLDRQPE
jgi:formylglycine-generating enzyme required for sulfatase activity